MKEQTEAKKKVKSILVSQPKPEGDKSPYLELAKKLKVKVDFRPFIHVEGLTPQEFRQQRIQVLDHSAVIFTSRNAVDHFFRMCTETRVNVPESMKYFCMSEAIAFYLQKYVVYRKRKIFVGERKFSDLMTLIKKHNGERYLLPSSDKLKDDIIQQLESIKAKYTKSTFYRTVISDLSDLEDVKYDMLVFFSPSGIKSLYHNFPNFEQNDTHLAAFGATTHKAIADHNLRLDCSAPSPEFPSMTAAIEAYLKVINK
ncbi:MAG: uroporphyrinogen-III synthase [Salibacteraceae bacterium]|jgi:uroporphyrinogen-III synthase|nr:uroporphyrinogen-III synthase [Salibacteraceae bacterium]MDP4687882.1 uroporphyrinogen-III synthase [Salibacteraceae bacterium]MDP4762630.1 uroporphyrinogen-III synthase [Salibacteraceae bacterium]MDP4842827.1 uroporphyrinogen-III synthase [Salibacteraceae bacterium]MDP4933145.1 uroporphyrinogen-III synthase [Salibacteraceae bacterium]